MKLLIKFEDKYAQIFRADFHKENRLGFKSIIGETLLFGYLEALIPTGINFHSHFTYFEDGNYHFSIKYFDLIEKLYVDRKTFHNHIAITKNTGPDFLKKNEVFHIKEDKIPNDPLDMFMRAQPSEPWATRPLNHHFGTFSMHADGDYADKFNWDSNIEIHEEDLVVNFREYTNHTINFNAVLYNKENPAFYMDEAPAYPVYKEKMIESHGLIIKFSMFTVFNK